MRHPLPTNVRQLDALLVEVIEACKEGEGNVLRLPKAGFEASAAPSQSDPPPGSLGREELVAWLEQEEGNVARVARRTGIERTALYRLMERYGIERKGRE